MSAVEKTPSLLQRLRDLFWKLGARWYRVSLIGLQLHLVRFNVVVALISLAIALNSQAQEAFVVGAEQVGTSTLFLTLVLLLTMAAWFTSRMMLVFQFERGSGRGVPRESREFVRKVQLIVPRVLGFAVPLFIALGLAVAGLWLQAFVLALCSVAGWLVLRRLGPKLLGSEDLADSEPRKLGDLPVRCRWLLAAGLLLNPVLMVVFTTLEIPVGTLLGAPNVVLLGLTSILFAGNALAYCANTYGIPMISVLLLLALAFSFFNDNHEVRVVTGTAARPGLETPVTHLTEWLQDAPACATGGQCVRPVFVVSAAGGGIRAAYWTADVLGELRREYGSRFTDNLYAISGVSGGSLGAAAFVADGADGAPDLDAVRRMLSRDYLAPTVATMLFPDLVQRFLPFAFFDDRAQTLEESWERAWQRKVESDAFGAPFDDLWRGGRHAAVLLLNSTLVETGERVVISPYAADGPQFARVFPGAVDARSLFPGRTLRLSTAVLLSARFTYVSPAGTVRQPDGDGRRLRLVDGGYFENHGVTTAYDVLRAVRRVAAELGVPVRPVLIHIDNSSGRRADPAAPWDDGGRPLLAEVLSPIEALLATRNARGDTALAGVRSDLGRDVVEFRLYDEGLETSARVPLGWMLSKASTEYMDSRVRKTPVACEAPGGEPCSLYRIGRIIDQSLGEDR